MSCRTKHLIKDGLLWRSISDRKRYSFLQLNNGLKITLISDPLRPVESDSFSKVKHDTRLASAALSVTIGSFDDPLHAQGLAHLLEHVMNSGNEKYPQVNGMDEFIQQHSGLYNAYTLREQTLYYFKIPCSFFEEALDRFAAQFHQPLFMPTVVTNEINPVNNEFLDAASNDYCRLEQLIANLAKKGHPLGNFMFGNTYSLLEMSKTCNMSIDQMVRDHWKKYYHAGNMNLVVEAPLSIDHLTELVTKYFSTIPGKNELKTINLFNDSFEFPYTDDFFKLYIVEPTDSADFLRLTWWLPPRFNCYKKKPMHFISTLAGHEGKGSLFSYLRRNGYILELLAGTDELSGDFNTYQSQFMIEVKLTKKGLSNIEDIVQTILCYMEILRQTPLKIYLDEEVSISLYKFQYADAQSPHKSCCKVAHSMTLFPVEDILIGQDLADEYDEDFIKSAFEYLVGNKANIIIASQIMFDSRDDLQTNTENWFNTQYKVENVPEKWLKFDIDKIGKEIHLPAPNVFITSDFNLCGGEDTIGVVSLYENEYFRTWYKKNICFGIPKSFISVMIASPYCIDDPFKIVCLELFVEILNFVLSEDIYPSAVAGLSEDIIVLGSKIIIQVTGFSQNLSKLLWTIIDKMLNIDFTNDVFEIVKSDLISEYNNKICDSAALAREIKQSIIEKSFVTSLEKRETIDLVTADKLISTFKSFLINSFVEILIQGNVTEKEALKISEELSLKLKPLIKKPYKRVHKKVRKLPLGANIARILSFNKEDKSSVIQNYYQLFPMKINETCILQIFVEIINEKIFDKLRTEQLLGYVVCCYRNICGLVEGYVAYIQSSAESNDCSHVNSRIRAFLKDFVGTITSMEYERFDEIRKAIIEFKSKAPLNLKNEAGINWNEILSLQYCFNRKEKEIESLKKLTIDEFKNQSLRMLDEMEQHLLAIQIIGNGKKAFEECYLRDANSPEKKLNTLLAKEIQKNFNRLKKGEKVDPKEACSLKYLNACTPLEQGQMITDINLFKQTLEEFLISEPIIIE